MPPSQPTCHSSRIERFFPALLLLLFISACWTETPKRPESSFSQPLPYKDEIALINNRPFTLTLFMKIRSLLTDKKTETVYWTGASSILLLEKYKKQNITISESLEIARFGLGEPSTQNVESILKKYSIESGNTPSRQNVRRMLDQMISEAKIQKNQRLLNSI